MRQPGTLAFGVLVAAVVLVLVLIWAVFGPLDPTVVRLSPAEHPMFFPLLMMHVVSTSLALVTVVAQLSPWLRRRHLRVHRICGRVYVFAGVLPAAVTALVLTLIWAYSPLVAFRDIPISVLWIAVTAYGLALAARGRIAEHRRWMLRSFAITGAVLLSPILDLVLRPFLATYIDTDFAGSEFVYLQVATASRLWLSTFITLIAVEWWLERDFASLKSLEPGTPARCRCAGSVPGHDRGWRTERHVPNRR